MLFWQQCAAHVTFSTDARLEHIGDAYNGCLAKQCIAQQSGMLHLCLVYRTVESMTLRVTSDRHVYAQINPKSAAAQLSLANIVSNMKLPLAPAQVATPDVRRAPSKGFMVVSAGASLRSGTSPAYAPLLAPAAAHQRRLHDADWFKPSPGCKHSPAPAPSPAHKKHSPSPAHKHSKIIFKWKEPPCPAPTPEPTPAPPPPPPDRRYKVGQGWCCLYN